MSVGVYPSYRYCGLEPQDRMIVKNAEEDAAATAEGYADTPAAFYPDAEEADLPESQDEPAGESAVPFKRGRGRPRKVQP